MPSARLKTGVPLPQPLECLSPLHKVHEHFWQEEGCPKQDCSGQCSFHNSLQGESKTSVVKQCSGQLQTLPASLSAFLS